MLFEDVKKSIISAGFNRGDKMPSVRSMAKQLKVSVATIHKIYKELTQDGFIVSYQGKGCFWGECPAAIKPQKSDTNSVVAEMFGKDLESGYLDAFESLPSIKELSIRYRVSPYSIKMFLNHQVAKGSLRRVGYKYFFDTERTSKSMSYILFVHRSDESGRFLIESEREQEVFRTFSRFSSDQKIAVKFLGYHEGSDKLFAADGTQFVPKEDGYCLGVFISTWLVRKPTMLFNHFAKFTIPISVWWEYAPNEVPQTTRNRKKWAFYNVAFGKEGGLIVGQHLKSKGLKKIHFISPFHSSFWSNARLEGLLESGMEVEPLVDNRFASPFDVASVAQREGFTAQVYLKNMIEELLDKASLDAFVCANDWVATLVIEIFKQRNKPRPYIIGFDDTFDSYRMVFDSLAFNVDAMVKEALYHIVSPGVYVNFRSLMQNPLGKVVEKK